MVVSDVNAADDAAQSFERLKAVYDKTGTNGLQAFELWKKLSEEDRRAAFAHAQRMQGSSASRSYLFVYLRDRQWEYVERYGSEESDPKPLVTLSSGEMRKYQLIRALLGGPSALVIDNPYIGLDPATRAALTRLLRDLSASMTLPEAR